MQIDIPPQLAIPGMISALAVVFWSADKVLLNAVALSRQLHVPPFIIGAIVIGFGTSAPEISTSIFAALNDKLSLAVGNALGSNTANLLLVLGLAVSLSTLTVPPTSLRRKSLVLILATLLPGLLLLDDHDLSRSDATILLLAFAVCLYYLHKIEVPLAQNRLTPPPETGNVKLWLVVSLLVLIIASQVVVSCAISTARYFEISELIIGLSVIAIGTSLPELSTTVASVRRKHYTVALGNIFGSNIFNSLAVIGIPVMIAPGIMPSEVLSRDYPVVIGATLLLFLLLFLIPPRLSLGRIKGLLLLGCFAAYQATLYLAATA